MWYGWVSCLSRRLGTRFTLELTAAKPSRQAAPRQQGGWLRLGAWGFDKRCLLNSLALNLSALVLTVSNKPSLSLTAYTLCLAPTTASHLQLKTVAAITIHTPARLVVLRLMPGSGRRSRAAAKRYLELGTQDCPNPAIRDQVRYKEPRAWHPGMP